MPTTVFDPALNLNPTAELDEMAPQLLGGIERFAKEWTERGEAHVEALKTASEGSEAEREGLFFHFRFAERAKRLLLLWRDVLFQHYKGLTLHHDQKTGEAQLQSHWQQSVKALQSAYTELMGWAEEEGIILQPSNEAEKTLSTWRLQSSPWPVYREQFEAIEAQAGDLAENHEQALTYAASLQKLKAAILSNARLYTDKISSLEESAREALKLFHGEVEYTPAQVARQLATYEEHAQLPFSSAIFTRQLETLEEALPESWTAIAGTRGGLLIRKEVDLRRRTSQWLEGEVLTVLYDFWELASEAINGFIIVLSNLRNRLQMLPDGEPFDHEGYSQPLALYLERLQEISDSMLAEQHMVETRLAQDFALSRVYDLQRSFMPNPMQLTVRRLGQSGGQVLDRVGSLAKQVQGWSRQLLRQVAEEESLSFAEKTVRFLEHRKARNETHAYTSIFLTKGFVGNSFASGREKKIAHIKQLYQQWQQGYRGAVLLTGRRFCGKTFFGEWAANRLAPRHILRLVAGQETIFLGRKFAPTRDLGAVLEFVKKYALSERPLLWLDDLELWQDASHNFFDNMAALLQFIDRHASRCFVLAATNQWAYRHLQNHLDIDRGFQATLQLNVMTRDAITHALLIRHGATHKQLVMGEDHEQISPQAFQRLAEKAARAAHGNMGEALIWWAASSRLNQDGSVNVAIEDRYSLPENPDPEANLLLGELLWQKRTDEYRLRRQFGPGFSERYGYALRRLLGMGVLRRTPDGKLELEDAVVNAVAGKLEK